MTMYMFKKIAVTSRNLCKLGLKEQVEKISKLGLCDALILREKDLSEAEYLSLAKSIKKLCDEHGIDFICNNMPSAASKLDCGLQLSYQSFLEQKHRANSTWVSVHSLDEAIEAESLGADALIAGHIFATDCKKGLESRGIDFLIKICEAVSIPVFAIGGIDDDNTELVKQAGAKGECRMSWYMKF